VSSLGKRLADIIYEANKDLIKNSLNLVQPELPYAGTSGWSGSAASMDRAIQEDVTGVTSKRQKAVLEYLDFRDDSGATWGEVADYLGIHHGSASGTLSVLHKAGKIARLKARRYRSSIYVLPEFVDGRETSEPGRTRSGECSNCGWKD
jgi:hypothetical protein